jgi:hypothetical protein
MLQKLLRITAILLLISLVFSPIYYKHVKHYLNSFRVIEVELENFSDISDGLCNTSEKIKIPAGHIQVLNIMSARCYACIENLPKWKKFPEELYKHLILKKMKKSSQRIEIINLIDDKSEKEFLTRLIDEGTKEKLKNINVSLCSGLISRKEIEEMQVEMLPGIIILKNGNVAYSIYGQLNEVDVEKISLIVSSLVS